MKTTATLLSEIASTCADNITRNISPAILRARLVDLVAWLTYVESAKTISATAHGFSATDVGKPIGWQVGGSPAIWDDAATTQTEFPVGILAEVPDANSIRLAAAGEVVTIDDALLPAGMPSPGGDTNARMPWWDKSAGQYVATKPADAMVEIQLLYYVRASGVAGKSVVLALAPTAPSDAPLA